MDELHQLYQNHIMGCRACYAPTARYCAEGERLRADYVVDFIMSRPDQLARRAAMVSEKRNNPHLYDQINRKVRQRLGLAEA